MRLSPDFGKLFQGTNFLKWHHDYIWKSRITTNTSIYIVLDGLYGIWLTDLFSFLKFWSLKVVPRRLVEIKDELSKFNQTNRLDININEKNMRCPERSDAAVSGLSHKTKTWQKFRSVVRYLSQLLVEFQVFLRNKWANGVLPMFI